jgi:hypothetical protein
MLAATPIGGGHYFADVLAGVAITVLAIYAARAVGRMAESRPAPQPTAAAAAVN